MNKPLTDNPMSSQAKDKVRACPACGHWSTDAERRGGYGRGLAPRLCVTCQRQHPDERWCDRCNSFEGLTKGCATLRLEKRRAGQWAEDKEKPCPACGKLSTDFERRGGVYKQGPAPRLCFDCQTAHPAERWCDRCQSFETQRGCPARLRERDEKLRLAGKYQSMADVTCEGCGATGKPSELRASRIGGRFTVCDDCRAARDAELVQCPACTDWWPRGEYFNGMPVREGRDRSTKFTPCPDCRRANPNMRWCAAHKTFEPESAFGGWSVRSCREGAKRTRHREDREALMRIHGTTEGQCMCCLRPMKQANVDHDHDCCSGSWSCGACVRGVICNECNVIEGKIRKVYGPPFPRLIQEYLDRAVTYRTQREVPTPN